MSSGAYGFGLTHRSDCHVYLLDGGKEMALIDAGTYAPEHVFRSTIVDGELDAGQRIRVGDLEVEVIASPGHSAGHVCYLVRDGDRSDLFSGDALLFGGRIILQDTWDCDLRAHIESLRRLDRYHFEGFFPGHLTFSVSDGRRHLDVAIAALDRGAIPPTLA